jgi:hypothetical protein
MATGETQVADVEGAGGHCSEGRSRRNLLLWISLLVLIYFFVGFLQPYRDAQIHAILANNILSGRGFLLSCEAVPDAFEWELHERNRRASVRVQAVDDTVRSLIDAGDLVRGKPDYLIQPTVFPNWYANTFLPGPAIWGLPFIGLFQLLFGSILEPTLVLALASKLASAVAAGGSVFLFYRIACRLVEESTAFSVSVVFAIGTCLFSVTSQLLMSHGPNTLFLLAGIDAYLRSEKDRGWAYGVGIFWGLAVWCRATSALMILAMGVWWLIMDRGRLVRMVAAGLPLALLMAWHNQHLFGTPWFFGELNQAASIDLIRGGGGVFQTPIWEGLAGLVFSPARGLLVYSPVLGLGVVGLLMGLRHRETFWLFPLVIGTAAIWAVQGLHFDWWGGWTFGYRPIVDTVPVLCLGLVNIYRPLHAAWAGRVVFRVLWAWSLMAQLVGVVLYDLVGWNGRELWEVSHRSGQVDLYEPWDETLPDSGPKDDVKFRVVRMNIDEPAYQYRLWAIVDSPLVYYLSHPFQSIAMKLKLSIYTAWQSRFQRAETLTSLGKAYRELGRPGRAIVLVRQAMELDAGNQERRKLLTSLEGKRSSDD